jgi:hypothetical protein
MIHNEEDLNRITGKLVKKTGMEGPSTLFTERVMQSVFAVQPPIEKYRTLQYLWFLLAVPVFIAACWYLTTLPEIMNKFLKYIDALGIFFYSIFSFIAEFVQKLEGLSKSPTILIGSLAVLILLVIETILTRRKYQL